MWSVMSDVCVLVFLTMRSWAAGSSPSDLLTFSVDTPTLLTPPTALHRSTHTRAHTQTCTHTQKLLIWLVKIKRLRLFVLHKLNFLNIMSVHIVAQRCCWYFFITIIKKPNPAPEAAVLSAVRDLISLFGNSDASQQLTSAQCLWLQLVLWTTTGNIVINKQQQEGQRSAFSSAVCPTVTGTTCKTGKMLKTGFKWICLNFDYSSPEK